MLNGFNFGFLGGGAGSVILAAILYSDPFTYTLDASGNTLMTNKGSLADADATVFSGSGVELQADNELPLEVSPNTYITLVNGDGTVEQIDNTADASTTYTLTNQTVLEATPTTAPFTTADLALIEADTSLMGRLALGEDYAGGLSLTTAQVFGWHPMMEKGGAFVVDAKAGYGIEKIGNGAFGTDTTWVKLNGSTIAGGFATVVCSGAITSDLRNWSIQQPNIFELNVIYVLEFDARQTVGVGKFEIGAGYDILFDDFVTSETTTYSLIVRVTFDHDRTHNISFGGTLGDEFTLDNVSVREATASEITNYLDTVRTNVDFNPKGNQGIEFERDGAGVPTAFNNTQMNFHGDGYADLGGIPDSGVEFIIEESVGAVFYSHIFDLVNLTTWTNGVEGAPVAHTPEGVNYLLGKGLYPKVTADPYTTYTQDHFKYTKDATEIANYDAVQAYNDYMGV